MASRHISSVCWLTCDQVTTKLFTNSRRDVQFHVSVLSRLRLWLDNAKGFVRLRRRRALMFITGEYVLYLLDDKIQIPSVNLTARLPCSRRVVAAVPPIRSFNLKLSY